MAPARGPQKLKVRKVHVKASRSVARIARSQLLTARHIFTRLPALFQQTQGRAFGVQAFRGWLQKEKSLSHFKLPSVQNSGELLSRLIQCGASEAAAPSDSTSSSGSRRIWERRGFYWIDPEGEATMNNVRGSSSRKRGDSTWFSWHEYGFLYQLCEAQTKSRASFVVTRTHAYKMIGSIMSKASIKVQAEDKQVSFRNVVTFDPWTKSLGRVDPEWTLIYLHSFSNKGTDYAQYPHYFGIPEASVRVVCPTAPLLEQTCFRNWTVWDSKTLKWRRIKFNAWFDYVTDRAGTAENKISLKSLLEMRARIHGLIREEIKRVGGDPKRVILGGASQGCCVALDAALTYPEELGGVIGLVGHVLSATPLDLAKERKSMPLHLFQEASDEEMNWKWVKGIIDRVQAAGLQVIAKRESDPAGAGHWIQDIEGRWICSALREIVTKRA